MSEKQLSYKEQFILGLKKQQAEMKKRFPLEKRKRPIQKVANKKVKPTIKKHAFHIPSPPKTEEEKREYMRKWRADNPDKIKQYRAKEKNDPIKIAHRAEYEKNRPNKIERLEQNRLIYHKNMLNPLFAEKEHLRSKLRRMKSDNPNRKLLEKQYKQAIIAWKESKCKN